MATEREQAIIAGIVRRSLDHMRRRTEDMIMGVPASQTTASTIAGPEGAAPSYEDMLRLFRSLAPPPRPLRVREAPRYTVRVQARRHPRKKNRLQKKWLRRYGTRTEERRLLEPGRFFWDRVSNEVWVDRDDMGDFYERLRSGS